MTLLCKSDASFSLPDEILKLYDAAAVQNINEAIAIIFHGFLLETGFIPKDVSDADIYKLMPKDWNINGIFKIKYSHNCCSSYECSVTCVPLGENVSVHGIICDTVCSESVHLKINLNKYLKQKKDLSNVCEIFSSIGELSRHFKDNFCILLLNLLHETAGVRHLFGFPGLYDDLKLFILMLLPVESIVSMSSVNKNLHFLGNLPSLWKYLFKRDCVKDDIPELETPSKTDWKEMYKKEYVKKNRRPEPRHYILPYHRLPRVYPYPQSLGSDWDFDFGINFYPPFSISSYIPPLPHLMETQLPHFFKR